MFHGYLPGYLCTVISVNNILDINEKSDHAIIEIIEINKKWQMSVSRASLMIILFSGMTFGFENLNARLYDIPDRYPILKLGYTDIKASRFILDSTITNDVLK